MKKITTALCLVLVCALLFCGCSSKNDGPKTSPSPDVSPLISDQPDNDNNGNANPSDGLLPDGDDGLVDDEDGLIDDGNGDNNDGTSIPSDAPTTSPAA